MIKVNLYKKAQDQLTVKKAKSGLDLDLELFTSDQVDQGRGFISLIPKILVVLLVPGILRAYSFYKLTTLETIKEAQAKRTDEVFKVNGQLRKENKKFKDDKAKAEVHKNKLLIFEKIAAERLDEVKTLDLLQETMIDGVWLKSVDYKQEDFSLKLLGLGDSDDSVNSFVEKLEKSDFFKEVYLISTKEETVDKVAIKAFEITSKITPTVTKEKVQ